MCGYSRMYMRICIYLYINTHTHSHCHEFVWTCLHGSACVYIYIYTYMYIYVHVHMHARTHTHYHEFVWSHLQGTACMCRRICMYVCIFVYLCLYTHTHAHNITNFSERFALCLFWGSRFAYMCIFMHVSVCVYRVFVCVCVCMEQEGRKKKRHEIFGKTHCLSKPAHTVIQCNTLHHAASRRNTLQHTATHCNTHCNTHCTTNRAHERWRSATTTHCNTLQHTATQYRAHERWRNATMASEEHAASSRANLRWMPRGAQGGVEEKKQIHTTHCKCMVNAPGSPGRNTKEKQMQHIQSTASIQANLWWMPRKWVRKKKTLQHTQHAATHKTHCNTNCLSSSKFIANASGRSKEERTHFNTHSILQHT